MAYIVPSILIQQQLASAGGVSASTPDLDTCIIGPAYNILGYVPGSLTSQIKTAAYSSVSTTGSMTLDGYDITVVSTAGFNTGDSVLVVGAGVSGATLQTIILGIAGNVISVDTAASTSVTAATITKAGIITDATIDNTFTLPGQIAGQVIDTASATVWLDNALVETLTSGFTINPNSNVVTMTSASTTAPGVLTALDTTVVVASAANLQIGDEVTIATAGTAGATLTTKITNIVGTTLTISPAIITTTLAGVAVIKVTPINLNSTTNTLRAEPGDKVKLTYIGVDTFAHVFTSNIQTVVTSSGLNGTVTNFTLIDSLPNSGVVLTQTVLVSVQKLYNDQQVSAVNPLTSGSNVDSTNTATTGNIIVKSGVSLVYGPVVSGSVFVAYRALRTDLSNRVLTINDALDLVGQLSDVTDSNPLGLAVQIALANTTGRVRAIAIASNDLAGHQAAMVTAEGERLYFLVPLTQDQSIIAAYKAHAVQMSTPENAAWRTVLANTAMLLTQNIGVYSLTSPNANSGNNSTALVGITYVLTASNATFITDGVTAGDAIYFTAATAAPSQVGVHTVVSVISNQQLVVDTTAAATAISYYITRSMSKTQTAAAVAAVSSGNNSSRVIHVQPDIVGVTVNGVVKYLPGYYLCAGLGGMGAGFPVQQGFTNVGVAGIVDLQHSNFYFSKADLNTMAGAGTCLFVQDTQGGTPYCRHELTTDMTSLNSREILIVKELDFLSYFYFDKLKSFVGSWNITRSSLNTLRQTIVAGSELIRGQNLPKIGAVLLSYSITTLEQDAVNKDHVTCVMTVAVGTPMNYVDLTLVV